MGSPSMYGSDTGVARRISEIYSCVDGINRRIYTVYGSDTGVARICFLNKFDPKFNLFISTYDPTIGSDRLSEYCNLKGHSIYRDSNGSIVCWISTINSQNTDIGRPATCAMITSDNMSKYIGKTVSISYTSSSGCGWSTIYNDAIIGLFNKTNGWVASKYLSDNESGSTSFVITSKVDGIEIYTDVGATGSWDSTLTITSISIDGEEILY